MSRRSMTCPSTGTSAVQLQGNIWKAPTIPTTLMTSLPSWLKTHQNHGSPRNYLSPLIKKSGLDVMILAFCFVG